MQTTSRCDEIVKLREAGLSYAKIGNRFGISRERVRQILKLKPTPQKPNYQARVMLTISDVAQLLGLHPNTVRYWSKKGILKAYRIGPRCDRRFRREDIESLLSEQANDNKQGNKIYYGDNLVNGTTVMIIDKQLFFRDGMRQALSQQCDFKILDCAPDNGLLELIEVNSPDVVLLDIDFPALSGLQLGRKITQRYPNTKVIMLSPNVSDEELSGVIETGAVAYLNKNTAAEELVSVIRRACRGEYHINNSFTARPQVDEHVRQFQDIMSAGKMMEPMMPFI